MKKNVTCIQFTSYNLQRVKYNTNLNYLGRKISSKHNFQYNKFFRDKISHGDHLVEVFNIISF